MSGGEFIDIAGWKRRPHFELFRQAVQPFFSVTVDVDVTALREGCDDPRDSFFLRALFVLLKAVHESEPLRLRLRGERVWRHDRVGIGTTILRPDETYGLARFDLTATYEEFLAIGHATILRVKEETTLETMHELDDLVYHSTLPWLRFTAFTNAFPRHDAIPRVVFGKVFTDGAFSRMPVGIEVHHALVDGIDVARFVDRFTSHATAQPL